MHVMEHAGVHHQPLGMWALQYSQPTLLQQCLMRTCPQYMCTPFGIRSHSNLSQLSLPQPVFSAWANLYDCIKTEDNTPQLLLLWQMRWCK